MLGETQKSYIYEPCIEAGYRCPDINDFKVIGSNFWKNVLKYKVGEVFLIKQLKLTLNKLEKLIELKLLTDTMHIQTFLFNLLVNRFFGDGRNSTFFRVNNLGFYGNCLLL